MPAVTKLRQPTKAPSNFDEHKPGTISGNLKDNAELTTGEAVREQFTCAGVARIRIRFLATCAGVLKVRFMRSITNHNIEYPTNQPGDTDVTGNAERVVDIPLHYGEGRGYIEFVPSADGELQFCDLLMT